MQLINHLINKMNCNFVLELQTKNNILCQANQYISTYLLRVREILLHVCTECAMVRQNPVNALEIQDISLDIAQGLIEPAASVAFEVRMNDRVHLPQVGGELAHFLHQDLLVEFLRHDERVVGRSIGLQVDLAKGTKGQNSHAANLRTKQQVYASRKLSTKLGSYQTEQ